MLRIIASVIALCALASAATAQVPSKAGLLSDFTCPAATCTTTCQGTGPAFSVAAKDVKVFQFVDHPRRLWVIADGQVFVLGDDATCHFGGQTTIQFQGPPPIPPTPLPPVNPPCVCIGNQCNPPGCAPH